MRLRSSAQEVVQSRSEVDKPAPKLRYGNERNEVIQYFKADKHRPVCDKWGRIRTRPGQSGEIPTRRADQT